MDTAKAKWEEYFKQPSLWVDLDDDIGINSRGSSADPSQSTTTASALEELGRGLCTKTISTRLRDHVTNTVVQQNIDPLLLHQHHLQGPQVSPLTLHVL